MLKGLVFCLFLFPIVSIAQNDLYSQAEDSYVRGEFSSGLKLISRKIDKRSTAQDYLLRAMIYQELSLRSNAEEDFISALELDPEFLEAYFLFSKFLKDSFESERALASLNILLEKIEETETQGIFFKMDALGQQGVQVGSISSMESEVVMLRGLVYQDLNDYEKALGDFNAAIFMHPTADKHVNRALLYKQNGKKQEAINDLKDAIKLNRKYALAWYNLFILDQHTELPTYLKTNDDFGPMLSARAVEAVEKGEYHLAQKIYAQAIRLNPKDPILFLNAGRLDLRNGFNKRAMFKFLKAKELDPGKVEVYYLIGNVYFRMGEYQNALTHYEKYLRLVPNRGDIWYNAAMAYMELDQKTDGCKCLKRADQNQHAPAQIMIQKHCTSE